MRVRAGRRARQVAEDAPAGPEHQQLLREGLCAHHGGDGVGGDDAHQLHESGQAVRPHVPLAAGGRPLPDGGLGVPAIVAALVAVLLVAALLPHARALSFEEDDGLALGDAPGRPLYLNRFAIPPQVDAAAVHLRKQGPGAVIFAATVVVGNLDLVFPQLRLIKGLKFLKFLA